ncbi:MAG: glyoxylate/hydroxypyruvate reductase A, partial [Boseongicola sp.]
MTKVLFSAPDSNWNEYCEVLPAAIAKAGVDAEIIRGRDPHSPAAVDYIVYAPSSRLQDFSPYIGCKAVLSLWAGVEAVVGNSTLTMPLARMVDHGLTEGMVEWCVGHTLRHHLGMDAHIAGQDGVWRDTVYPPLARARPVTILGLGA